MSYRFLIRLALAGAGMALLCAAICAGLGWALWSGQEWLFDTLGYERCDRLYRVYANALAGILPGDRDSDGLADGFELFCRKKPDDPHDRAVLEFWQDADAFGAQAVVESEGIYVSTGYRPNDVLLLRANAPLLVRGRVKFKEDKFPDDFPKEFRLRITVPGRRVTLAPVARDGSVSFEISIPEGFVTDWRAAQTVSVDCVAADEKFFELALHTLRMEPSMEATVVDSTFKQQGRPAPDGAACWYELQWAPVPEPATGVLIEAAPEHDALNRKPVHIFPRDTTTCRIVQEQVKKHGPLKFRAVPVR